MYTEKESPLQYGILFAESPSKQTEIRWYETEAKRDDAVKRLLETGKMELRDVNSPLARTVKPHAFSTVNAATTYFSEAI